MVRHGTESHPFHLKEQVMPIDWEAELERVEQEARSAAEQRRQAERRRREAYLADRERIEREQPEAIELALGLLRRQPEHRHERIKQAAEVADLEKLKLCQVMPSGFAFWPFED
jgi:hypothetical protein